MEDQIYEGQPWKSKVHKSSKACKRYHKKHENWVFAGWKKRAMNLNDAIVLEFVYKITAFFALMFIKIWNYNSDRMFQRGLHLIFSNHHSNNNWINGEFKLVGENELFQSFASDNDFQLPSYKEKN